MSHDRSGRVRVLPGPRLEVAEIPTKESCGSNVLIGPSQSLVRISFRLFPCQKYVYHPYRTRSPVTVDFCSSHPTKIPSGAFLIQCGMYCPSLKATGFWLEISS